MITEVKAYSFAYPATVNKGDTLHVHCNGREVVKHDAEFTATWTHSIMFKLNGKETWIIGTQETIDWLRNMQNAEFRQPLTPRDEHDIMYGRGGF